MCGKREEKRTKCETESMEEKKREIVMRKKIKILFIVCKSFRRVDIIFGT
jgi:hypothetical protein